MLAALLLLLSQDPAEIRKALEASIPLLERGAAGSMKERSCFTCHNLGVPLLALAAARERGFKVDPDGFRAILDHTRAFLERNRENYAKGKGQGGQVDTAGWALWTLEAGGAKPDESTSAVAHYLAVRDRERGYWINVSTRPPSEASPFTATFLAIAGLRAFAQGEDKAAGGERIAQARAWLLGAKPKDTEDRVFRLRALEYSGAEAKDVEAAAKELRDSRRADGGWAQLPDGESDAYATGTALAALAQAGGLATADPVYRKGLSWLLAARKEDGSWQVRSRSKPFQTYFESGFPHGKDQFISITASAWATLALALALPK